MNKALAVVNRILEADDDLDSPEAYLDWAGKKADAGELESVRFGARIITSSEDEIREAAQEKGIDVDNPDFWQEIERGVEIIEDNCLDALRQAGLRVQDEGHDDTGRVASLWIDTGAPAYRQAWLKAVLYWAENEVPSTTSGTMDYAFGAGTVQRIYAGVPETAHIVEVTVEFVDTDRLAEWAKVNFAESVEDDIDDPAVNAKHYIDQVSPETCPHCHGDLTQPESVVRNYVHKHSGQAYPLIGHYGPDRMFEPDESPSKALLDTMGQCDLPEDSDSCANCFSSTLRVRRHESEEDDVDSPSGYLGGIHDLNDIVADLERLNLAVAVHHLLGRWIMLDGFQIQLHNAWADHEALTEVELRAAIEQVMQKYGITQFHLQTTVAHGFKLALPKSQLARESYADFNVRPAQDWLPESEEEDVDDPSAAVERYADSADIDAIMARLGFKKSAATRPAGRDLWIKCIGNDEWRVWPTPASPNVYGITHMTRPAKFVQVGRGRRYGQWSDKGHFTCHVSGLEQRLSLLVSGAEDTVEESAEVSLPPEDNDETPAAAADRYASQIEKDAEAKLDSTIEKAVRAFDIQLDRRGVNNAERADELAAEIGGEIAVRAGYPMGSDEYTAVVSAVTDRAGEMFPGDYDDYDVEDEVEEAGPALSYGAALNEIAGKDGLPS